MKVAGFGYRGAATADSLLMAYQAAGGRADALAVPEDKADAPCLVAFAAKVGLPVQPVAAEVLESIATPTQAPRVIEKRGTGSVAEACALAVAGPESRLIATRVISEDRMATCAIAGLDKTKDTA